MDPAVDTPGWIVAIIGIGGAFAGVARAIYRLVTRHQARQRVIDKLAEDVWGMPARADSRGVVYEQAHTGLEQRTATLEERFARHTGHPPGRPRNKGAAP